MAIEPEFVRLIKRWVIPIKSKEEEEQGQKTTNSGVKPIQLDDDEDNLR